MTEDKIFIDVEKLAALANDPVAFAFIFDIIMAIWWPAKEPIVVDAEQIVNQLKLRFPGRGYTLKKFEEAKPGILNFFTVLPDGRWVPDPEFFSLTGGDN